jgi:hypothetical protein
LNNVCGACRFSVLPNPHDEPTRIREHCVRVSVSLDVLVELRTPPNCIVLWVGPVLGAAVPEATVDKNGKPLAREDNVCAAAQSGYRRNVDPVAKAAPVEFPTQGELWLGVPIRHPLEALAHRLRRWHWVTGPAFNSVNAIALARVESRRGGLESPLWCRKSPTNGDGSVPLQTLTLSHVLTPSLDGFQIARGCEHPDAIVKLDFHDRFIHLAVQRVKRVEGLAIARLSFTVSSRDRMEDPQSLPVWHGYQHSNMISSWSARSWRVAGKAICSESPGTPIPGALIGLGSLAWRIRRQQKGTAAI